MDAEDFMWLTLIVVIIATTIAMLLYAVFVVKPEHDKNIALCEQAGGIAVTDDSRYRFCVDSVAVIQIPQSVGASNED